MTASMAEPASSTWDISPITPHNRYRVALVGEGDAQSSSSFLAPILPRPELQ